MCVCLLDIRRKSGGDLAIKEEREATPSQSVAFFRSTNAISSGAEIVVVFAGPSEISGIDRRPNKRGIERGMDGREKKMNIAQFERQERIFICSLQSGSRFLCTRVL